MDPNLKTMVFLALPSDKNFAFRCFITDIYETHVQNVQTMHNKKISRQCVWMNNIQESQPPCEEIVKEVVSVDPQLVCTFLCTLYTLTNQDIKC